MQNEPIRDRHKPALPVPLLWIGGTAAGWALGFVPLAAALNGSFSNGTDYNPAIFASVCYVLCAFVTFAFLSAYSIAEVQSRLLAIPSQSDAVKWRINTTIAITVGWVLGWLGSIWPLTALAANKPLSWVVSGLVMGVLIGLCMGVAQWRLFRRMNIDAGTWILRSVAGWAAAMLVYWLVYWAEGGPFEATVTSYYEGSYWPKTVEASGLWPAMIAGWIAGGLVLGIITASALKIMTKGAPTAPEIRRAANAPGD